jgi:hypothetical protein
MMRLSKFVSAGLSLAVIGAAPGVALCQILPKEPQAAIEAQTTTTSPEIHARLVEIGRRLQEAKLANFARPVPQTEYVEAQREAARGDFRAASVSLDQVEQRLNSTPD